MILKNLSEHKVSLLKEGELYIVEYLIPVKEGSDTTIQFLIEDTSPLTAFNSAACGCLTIRGYEESNSLKVTVKYDSKRTGIARKTATWTWKRNGRTEKAKVQFRLDVK